MARGSGFLKFQMKLFLFQDPFGYAAYYLPYLLVAELVAKNGGVDPVPILIGGATAGFFSWMITNPFDVVKTIYQSESKKKSGRSVLKQLLKVIVKVIANYCI